MAIALGPIQQAATGSVVAGGAMNAGGAGAMSAGTADPRDFPGDGRRNPKGATAVALAAAAAFKTMANVLTQQYKDNKDNDEKKCKTFPYSDKGKECKGGKAHHMVPDRAWRSPGTRGTWTGNTPIDAILSDARESIPIVGQRYTGGYYYSNMDEGKGLSICVSGDEHSKIHDKYDREERKLGSSNKPQYTAKLPELEELAAEKISEVTGCNKERLLNDMYNHHRGLGFNDNTIVRADPSGISGLDMQKMNEVVTGKKPGGTGF